MPALFHPLISAPPLMTGLSPSAASIIVGEYGFPESSCVKVMVLSRLYVPPFSMIWISPTGESFCLNFLACASAFPIVAKGFSSVCEEIYQGMYDKNFVTSKGDEFILSLAADKLKAIIKNAFPYVCRFWTGASFRLVSTCYEYNRVTVLHMPAEKDHGMLKMYGRYISHGIVPDDQIVWRTFRLSRQSIVDKVLTCVNKSGIRKFVSSRRK